MSKIWVVAGNYDQAKVWMKKDMDRRWDAGETTLSKSEYILLHDVIQLRGHNNPHGVFVGTWRDRDDIREIVAAMVVASIDKNGNEVLRKIYNELGR